MKPYGMPGKVIDKPGNGISRSAARRDLKKYSWRDRKLLPVFKNPEVKLFPEYDEIKLRPVSKMPDCPNCGKDELGMLSKSFIVCYNCYWRQHKKS